MRDELGFARNARGSMGISTRGRDTGDAQIYFNSADNFRLDRDYTVFASILEGMSVMDRVEEGDVIDRVEIVRVQRR
jgi:cyclophilin family peptidyl-prolyl cis-trans isomerase